MDVVAMFQDGGLFMWAILACAVMSAAICSERLLFLYVQAPINAVAFSEQVTRLVLADQIDRAIKLCNAEPHALLPRVIRAGLLHADEAEADISNAVEEVTLEVSPLVNRRSGHLGMLANVATLLGLLGTIDGLITAFEAVGHASAEARSAMLGQGIAVAMHATFFGLVVAIPTLVVHSLIQSAATSILDDIDEHGFKTVNLLAARRRGVANRG